MSLRILIFTFLIMGVHLFGYSQQVSVSLNKNNILIGEQINLAINVPVISSSSKVNFNIPDTIPHFDIISKDNSETKSGDILTFQKLVVLTSFDSGAYTFPSIKIDLNENGKLTQLYSPSILITVGYSKEDSLGIRDLKPLRMAKVESKLWIYVIASILAILLMWLLIKYLIKINKGKKENYNWGNHFQQTINDLNNLEKSGLNSKQFHIKLSNIFRQYYTSEFKNNMLVQTTGDILVQLKSDGINETIVNEIASPLRLGDAVKYAKYKSQKDYDLKALKTIKDIIIKLNKINAKG